MNGNALPQSAPTCRPLIDAQKRGHRLAERETGR
jgi:hypothetical protein